MQDQGGTSRERRKTGRRSFAVPVHFSTLALISGELVNVTKSGQSVDMSEDRKGLGFITDFPLYSGQILRMVRNDDDVLRTVVVQWVDVASEECRVGAVIV